MKEKGKADSSSKSGRLKRVTLSEIAEKAGVSRQVVSAVLGRHKNSNIRFSIETYERVMTVVKAMNWRPNRTALSLAQQRHGAIGILIENFGCIQDNVLRFMSQRAHESGQLVMFDCITGSEDDVSVFIREDCVDAVVIFHEIDSRFTGMIETFGIPLVRVNTDKRYGPGCITFDEEGGLRELAAHFAGHGRKKALMFQPGSGGYWTQARARGLREGSELAGMKEPLIIPFDRKFHDPRQFKNITDELRSVLTEHSDVDCAVLSSDRSAPMFYHVLDKMGKRLHHDFSIASINDSGAAALLSPQLTSLQLETKKLGKHIVDIVNAGINGEPGYEKPEPIPYKLAVRESS